MPKQTFVLVTFSLNWVPSLVSFGIIPKGDTKNEEQRMLNSS